MNGYCISDKYCMYKTDTGYCGYTSSGCVLDNSITVEIPTTPSYTITRVVDISTESINKIAEAVVEKMRNCWARIDGE